MSPKSLIEIYEECGVKEKVKRQSSLIISTKVSPDCNYEGRLSFNIIIKRVASLLGRLPF